jgi:hypothetical protein
MTPEMILALSLALEAAIRGIVSEITAMNEEELDAFIAQKEQEKAEHDAWLEEQLGG